MWEMKGDMSGAAIVLHAALAAKELGINTRVTSWLCLAENMVDGGAYRNADVFSAYNNKTIEVQNTDAEGRLVMADGLGIASTENPDLLFDVATLTGAQVTALGDRTAGLMGDDVAKQAIEAAQKQTGEPFWAMPFPDELRATLDSYTADIKNVAASGGGGMLVAGIFLSEFVGEGAKGKWGHLDIAGPAFNDKSAYGYQPEQGTAFSLRTLVKVAQNLAQTD